MSSLNGTFERKGWPNILSLISKCERVKQLSAICKICNGNANYTFRHTVNKEDDPNQPLVGGSEQYMPVCRECYQEKTEQAKLLKKFTPDSGSESTAFNDSTTFKGEQLLEQRQAV
jgi:thymidine kinase